MKLMNLFHSVLQYLALPPVIAPIKCSVLPLSGKPEFAPFVRQLCTYFTALALRKEVS